MGRSPIGLPPEAPLPEDAPDCPVPEAAASPAGRRANPLARTGLLLHAGPASAQLWWAPTRHHVAAPAAQRRPLQGRVRASLLPPAEPAGSCRRRLTL